MFEKFKSFFNINKKSKEKNVTEIVDISEYQAKNNSETILKLICERGKFIQRYINDKEEYCFYTFQVKDMFYYLVRGKISGNITIWKGTSLSPFENYQFVELNDFGISEYAAKIFIKWIDVNYPISAYPYIDYNGNTVDWLITNYDKEIKFFKD